MAAVRVLKLVQRGQQFLESFRMADDTSAIVMAEGTRCNRIVVWPASMVAADICVVLFLVHWKHNQSTYPLEYAYWNRSFICERCGAVSEQELGMWVSPEQDGPTNVHS